MHLCAKKILMLVLCITILSVTLFFFLIPTSSVICFVSIAVAAGISPFVGMGFKNRDNDFLRHIPLYGKFVVALFILTFFVIPIFRQPECGSLFFFMWVGVLANSILYTSQLFFPTRFPLEKPTQNE